MSDKTDSADFYKPYFCYEKILCIIFAIAILVLSFVVLCSVLPVITNYDIEAVKNPSFQNVQVNRMEVSDNKDEFRLILTNVKKEAKSKSLFMVMIVLFFVLALSTFVVIILIFANSDGGIRFAKLNELRNLRQYMGNINDIKEVESEKIEEIVKTQSAINELSLKFNNPPNETSNININHNFPVIKNTKEKNLYAEFLKNYMSAIVEI